ncbi:unnamed protein product [Moneuplotes crassus]|uniref:Kinesin motor domain-containing protein n=1 Tax=Euplotes crassus TaxID=5936 RepID=A0AAD1Y6L3_EUPCR|nr:unnamed protein product [Moneuplotes crassus]
MNYSFAYESKASEGLSSFQISKKATSTAPAKRYYLDDVFSESVTNKQVYNKFCKDLVLRVCDGYNGTIFAYGQTSSGKTHTMIGKKGDSVNLGVDCLAVQQLFDYAAENDSSEITVWVSYMEIYNEVINDLLDKDSTNLKIREDTSNSMGAYVEGLKSVRIQNYEEFMEVLEKGEKVRQYGQTKLSEKYTDVYSSRSHTIVRIMVQNKPNSANFVKDQDKQLHMSFSVKYSILNLVDLAGSERLSDVGLDRTKETSHINTSLFVLSKVINCLASKSKSTHIPFRDSKLTQLLKNSLGGNSMTSVICTVSPNLPHLPLTVSTLEFAKRAKNIKVKARANEVIDDHDIVQNRVKAMEAMIAKLERNIDQLNEEMSQHKQSNFDLKLQIRDYEDKIRMYNQQMTEEVNTQFKDSPQDGSMSVLIPETPKIPKYISYTDINTNCTQCGMQILNASNLFVKSKGLINPSDSELYQERLDQIESFITNKFQKCDDCQTVNNILTKEDKATTCCTFNSVSAGCQTDETLSDDYMFFYNMVEGYLKQCLQAKAYKVVKKDFKLKDSNKYELYMDFFRAKVAIKNKIQAFIDKYESAHTIQEKIEAYSTLLQENKKNKKRGLKSDSSLNKQKEIIIEELSRWANLKNSTKPKISEDIKSRKNSGLVVEKKEKMLMPARSINPSELTNPYKLTPTSMNSIDDNRLENFLNSPIGPDNASKEIAQSKITPKREVSLQSSLKKKRKNSIRISNQRGTNPPRTNVHLNKTKFFNRRVMSNLKSRQKDLNRKENSRTPLNIAKENLPALKKVVNTPNIKNLMNKIPSRNIITNEEDSFLKARYPAKLPSMENAPEQPSIEDLEVTMNFENPISPKKMVSNDASVDLDLKDPEILEDRLEDILIEELDSEDEDFGQDEQYLDSEGRGLGCENERWYFEFVIQRHEDLQNELEECMKKRISTKFHKRDYNTFVLGDNREGRCGTGENSQFTEQPTLLKIPFRDIQLGYHHSAGISMQGIAYTWGRSTYGQLGQGAVINQRIPSLLAQPLERVEISEISCGWQHTLAVTVSGYLYSWGLNMNGQLGLGDFKDRNIPTLVEKSLSSPVDKVSAGHSHSAMIDNNSQLYTWGANPDSRLCKKTTYYKLSMRPKDVNKPLKCKALENIRIVDVSCGHEHSLFLDNKGIIYASGDPSKGELGDPYYHPDKAEQPYFAHYFLTNENDRCIKVKAGDGFSVFLSCDGSVYTCGQGNYGRLGHENCSSLSKPAVVQYFKYKNAKIVDIETGGRHTYAISDKRELFVWGFGFYHQLPTSSREDCEEPVKIPLPKPVSNISCGYFHSSYILTDETLDNSS